MSNPFVLILTQEQDAHVPPVEKILRRYDADVLRFDLGDFPERIQLVSQMKSSGIARSGYWSASIRGRNLFAKERANMH